MKVSNNMRILLLVAMLSSLGTPCMSMFTKTAHVARSAQKLSRHASNYSPELGQWLFKNRFKNPHDKRGTFIFPIHQAIVEKDIPVIFELIVGQGADVNAIDDYGQTALMGMLEACNNREWDKENSKGTTRDPDYWDYEDPETFMLLRFLITVDADVNAATKYGKTALHFAADGGNNALQYVKLLLNEGAEVNAKDTHDFTPLHIAAGCIRDSLEIVTILCDWGADLNALNNQPNLSNQKTPLQWAEFCNNKFYYGSLASDYYPTLRRLLNPKNVGPHSGE